MLQTATCGSRWVGPAAIGRITPTGTITAFPTPTLNSLPFGLAVGPDHGLWFPERNGDKIGSIPTHGELAAVREQLEGQQGEVDEAESLLAKARSPTAMLRDR